MVSSFRVIPTPSPPIPAQPPTQNPEVCKANPNADLPYDYFFTEFWRLDICPCEIC